MPPATPVFLANNAPALQMLGRLAMAVMWNRRVGLGAGMVRVVGAAEHNPLTAPRQSREM